MFRMLVDTCVWLDVAKDPKQVAIVGVIEEMVKQKLIELIVPGIVLDEFRRNRERIANESAKSLATHIRLVKDALGKIGGDKRRMRVVLSHLDDVNHMATKRGSDPHSPPFKEARRVHQGIPAHRYRF